MSKSEKKYYWMLYSHNNIPGTARIYNEVITQEHPFLIMNKFVKSVHMNMVLDNWEEITSKEVDFFKQRNQVNHECKSNS